MSGIFIKLNCYQEGNIIILIKNVSLSVLKTDGIATIAYCIIGKNIKFTLIFYNCSFQKLDAFNYNGFYI